MGASMQGDVNNDVAYGGGMAPFGKSEMQLEWIGLHSRIGSMVNSRDRNRPNVINRKGPMCTYMPAREYTLWETTEGGLGEIKAFGIITHTHEMDTMA